LKEEIESKCRICKQHEEAIDHITSGCPILAKSEYLMSHDKVCAHLHYSVCTALGFETTDKWYTHMPKPVNEEGDVTLLCNQAVHTDREVTANRADIIIKNKKEKTWHTDRCGNTGRHKCAKGSGKEVKIPQFRYRDTTNEEPEVYDYTSYNWSHWNSNDKLKEKS
jgi:hypothetical protein